jgi:hypothetical protein
LRTPDDTDGDSTKYSIGAITLTIHQHPYEHLEALNRNINNLAIDAARLLNLPYKQVLAESVDDIFSVLYYENMKVEAQQRENKKSNK